MEEQEIVAAFERHDADEIGTMLGVNGWVPMNQVESLKNEVPDAYVQYTSEGHAPEGQEEAFVATE